MATRRTASTVRIITGDYESSHRRPPRGRGSWAFCPASAFRRSDYLDHVVFAPGMMSYAEAKAWLKREVARLGAPESECRVWTVCP